MDVKVLGKEEESLSLELSDFKVSLVNALRRAILNDVNTVAIDDVTIYKNTSSMYDEVLALRLGLIPIKTVPELNKKGKEFTFKLNESGPKTVYASDLKPSDDDVRPIYEKMLLMRLNEGEKIELEAKAVFGSGKEHAKFAPAHVTYHFQPVITTTKKEIRGSNKIASLCPVDILDGSDNKLSVKKGQLNKCILCNACEDFAGEDVIKISSDPSKIILNIESWGQLDYKEILTEAAENLETEAKELIKSLS